MKKPEAAKEAEASTVPVSRPSGSRGGGLLMKRRSTVTQKDDPKKEEKKMETIPEEDTQATRMAQIQRVEAEKAAAKEKAA
jgi:hypothetical protein